MQLRTLSTSLILTDQHTTPCALWLTLHLTNTYLLYEPTAIGTAWQLSLIFIHTLQMSFNFSRGTTVVFFSVRSRVENDFETHPAPLSLLGWSQSSSRVCFWKAAHSIVDDMERSCSYWLGMSRGREVTQPILSRSTHIITGPYCWWYSLPSSAMPHWSTDPPFACPCWLRTHIVKCPGMPQIKRKPWLVISLQLFPGLCWGAISPALKSEPLAMSQALLPSSERLFIKSLSCF